MVGDTAVAAAAQALGLGWDGNLSYHDYDATRAKWCFYDNQCHGYLDLVLSRFQEGIDLISLFPGKLCVAHLVLL